VPDSFENESVMSHVTQTSIASATIDRAEPPTSVVPRNQALYACTIFLGAFLLFEVQPLVAKEILPWFGGSAGVWTTCMLFFQLLLLGGYAYAHALSRSRHQWIHGLLLVASLVTLRIIPWAVFKPLDGREPVARILLLLVVTVGLPYFALSSTSPLLQIWYARQHQSRVPYRYFALSNLASMLALLSYPVLIEPRWSLHTQAWTWSAGFFLCTVLNGIVFRQSAASSTMVPEADIASVDPAPRRRERVLWVLLPACASALLLAVTNHLTQNIAAIPLLWVLPLGTYLLSFILTFDSERWYPRRVFLALFGLAVVMMGYVADEASDVQQMKILIPVFIIGLFFCCMVCHGELVRIRPAARWLTAFYLRVALGGALGGLFVAILAPQAFPVLLEFPLLLVITPGVILGKLLLERAPAALDAAGNELAKRSVGFTGWLHSLRHAPFWPPWSLAAIAVIALAGYLAQGQWAYIVEARLLSRNFYGALRVADHPDIGVRELAHGTICHGEQYLDPAKRRQPLTYYAPTTGIGLLMTDLDRQPAVRLGVIGLGAGTMAAWGRTGDVVRFYEINARVLDIARTQFTYLADCPCRTEVVLGDARLSLEREPNQHFDVLVVDAFSGDSIPVHLLTREAFEVYFRHLVPGGILAVHVSNSYLNLAAPLAALAHQLGHEAHLIGNDDDDDTRTYQSDWVLVGDQVSARHPWITSEESAIESPPGLRTWTDDFSNLWQILLL